MENEYPDTAESGESYDLEMGGRFVGPLDTPRRVRAWHGPLYEKRRIAARDAMVAKIPVCDSCGVRCTVCYSRREWSPHNGGFVFNCCLLAKREKRE